MEFTPRITSLLLEGREKAISVGKGFYRKPEPQPSEIYHMLADVDTEWLLFIMAKTHQEGTRRAISRYFRDLKEVRPKLRGRDLKDMGITPGPVYRRILNQLLDAQLNGDLTSREEELEFVRQHFLKASQN
jgi:tRNA nucleotidyltransferase (CCA-adding enzyme)